MIKIATAIMIMQDNLFITTNNLPDLSILPTDLPNKAKKINQIHETNIHVKVKRICYFFRKRTHLYL